MSPPTFNLLTEPFIPVTWTDPTPGAASTIGIRELFLRAQDIADLAVPSPPAASGLMRILYVLAAEISGLNDQEAHDDWNRERLRLAKQTSFDPQAVDRVLGTAAESRWDLFDERFPWLQDPRLATECPKTTGINKFVWGRVAGNNQVFVSHDTDAVPRPIPTSEAIWHLLAWLYYGPSGRCSARVVDGKSEANVTAGQLRRSLSIHPWAPTLYQTLIAGQVYDEYFDPDEDLPAWDEPQLHNPLGVPPELHGSRILAGQFRHAVQLVPNEDGSMVTDAYVTWSLRKPFEPTTDPYLMYAVNAKGEQFPRYADADRAIWRDLDALLRHDRAERKLIRPKVLNAATAFGVDYLKTLRIRVFAFDQDGQTRDRQYFTADTPPILDALAEDIERAHRIQAAVTAGNTSGHALTTTLSVAWRETTKADPKKTPPWLEKAAARYWSEAEQEFWSIVGADDPPGDPIPNAFILLAARVFDDATNEYAFNPRFVRALEEQRRWLFTGWQKLGDHT
ncbi:type I-E CRISPR-associated protein Cse1/CasA [Phytomonospora endophytica]|uniref:CRISPR system Cascade subunit CasA n=1 Tax=Phytomonospora endophytica TaxID=714109 RepID=A0A841FUA2_9ACTN|nr:type I-E CRISPR-associated protein Cse1/CasA [Phytomonospora endophytica]MBB6039586.1 CRISPR system Cascade subunit CasA [Phytomonospora endophytica]GIG70551.1 type I-E CRISPR-associated protein Cse1/CasA [Phytomonospora endophytica]